MEQPVRILLADDHPMMCAGLRSALEQEGMEVVAEATDGAMAFELFKYHRPDVALIDLQMPHVNGLQAITAIHAFDRRAVLIVLTSYAGDARVLKALSTGARSYLLKSAGAKEIAAAIRRTLAGAVVLGSSVAHDIAHTVRKDLLTEREIAVVRLIALGKPNTDIATELNISVETVKTRLQTLRDKLGAADRSHAVTLARQRGFLEP